MHSCLLETPHLNVARPTLSHPRRISNEITEAYTRSLQLQRPPVQDTCRSAKEADGAEDVGMFGEALLGPLAPVELLRRPRLRDYVAYL